MLQLQRDLSMLTFESASVAGVSGIIEKLTVRIPLALSFCNIRAN